MPRLRRILLLTSIALLVVVGGAGYLLLRGSASAEPRNVAPAPQARTSAVFAQASSFSPAKYTGKVLVVNFMAAWCSSCWGEIPGFVTLYRAYRADGLEIVGIAVQSTEKATTEMAKKLEIGYPVFIDTSGRVALSRYHLRDLPTTIIYDRQGHLYRRVNGALSQAQLAQIIRKLL